MMGAGTHAAFVHMMRRSAFSVCSKVKIIWKATAAALSNTAWESISFRNG